MQNTGPEMLRAVVFALILCLPSPLPAAAATFAQCSAGGTQTCVVDGDTFHLDGDTVRIMDIDAPETHPSRCPTEATLGTRSTLRLISLLNAGGWRLERSPTDHRNRDRYGRLLRIVVGPSGSLGAQLVAEGLARPWTGKRRPWC